MLSNTKKLDSWEIYIEKFKLQDWLFELLSYFFSSNYL